MMVTLKEAGPLISETDVLALEKRLGSSLPEPYRRFLLENNGGRPTPDAVDIEGLPGSPTDVQEFFGIGRSIKSSCLEWNLRTFAERLEKELLPIASDSGGSVFCLSIRERDRGAVLYCDLQSVHADFESQPKLYPVAYDFEAFVTKLRSFP